jgi:hypothetical protein
MERGSLNMQGAVAVVVKRNIRRVGIPATKRGRPRKTNVRRDASGKSRGEIVDLSVVLNQPHRRDAADPSSRMLGYALGRLAERGLIQGEQFRAGERWGALVASYRRQLLSAPPLAARSGEMAERVSVGFGSHDPEIAPTIDPEQAEKNRQELKAKYDAGFEALSSLGRVLCRGHAILNTVRKVCVDDRDPSIDEIGDLRVGLNSLGRVLFSNTGD